MSDFEHLDSEKLSSQLNNGGSSQESSTLVQLNANMPAQSSTSFVVGGEQVDGGSGKQRKSGGNSSKPQSGKLTAKPSSALLEAKRIALLRKRSSGEGLPVIIKDHLQPARDSKDRIRKETGVVYDMRMVEHYSPWDPSHPESPKRFTSIMQRCHELGLIERCVSIAPRYANLPELLTLHTPEHIELLYKICHESGEDIEKLEKIAQTYDSVYFNRATNELALLSCGSTIDLVRAVAEGRVQNGMAIVRPPGHHAMKEEFCGYCLFNNVAIAAKQMLESGLSKRVLIIDYDVHHGQATQQMFYNDPRVLYFSTHRYEHGTYWPNLEESNYNWIGTGEGIGFNCNIPLNKTGMGNSEFLTVWHQVLLPLAYKFNPDLVIVSAGYDAALGCPEFDPDLILVSAGYDAALGDIKGEMRMHPQCYPHLIHPLMGLANGKIAVVLEGGYCLKSLAEGAALTLRTLLGDPCPVIPPISTPVEEIASTILDSHTVLQNKWKLGMSRFLDNEEYQVELENGNAHLAEWRFDYNTPKPEFYPTRECHPIQCLDLILDLDKQLDQLCANTSLAVAKHRVGLIYDVIMLQHRNLFDIDHPERPERASDIFACHVDYGLVERCLRIDSREATQDELRLLHTEEHILRMRNTSRIKTADLEDLQNRFNSVYLHKSSYEAALHSAGSVLQAVDSVITGECQSAVAIVRPPGHHAEQEAPCGFCIFNNVALAAKYAIETHKLKKVLVIDWDVHHGNGIQHMFEEDPRVLYVSIHRYDHGGFFPGKKDADYDVVGRGAGKGFNVNIPWNGDRMGDTEYLAAFTNVVLPIAYEYAPELVLISAGFDAAQGDPLGGYKVTPEGYAHMTNLLMPLANGRIVLALEGGYNLTSIAYSMTMCTKALLGDPIPTLTLKEEISESAAESIRNVIHVQSSFWTVLKPFLKCLPTKIPVQLGNYEKKEPQEEDLVELMQKLGVNASPAPASDDVDSINGNLFSPSAGRSGVIPDPPPASGEPSSSLPRNQPNAPLRIPANNNAIVVDSNTTGSGEAMAATPVAPGPVVIAPNPGGAPAPQADAGAAGGSEPGETIENVYRVMTNRDMTEDNGQLVLACPRPWCPHLESGVNPIPAGAMNVNRPCQDCQNIGENWICLTCYEVFCSRYVSGHMVEHNVTTGHPMVLSFSDLSVWCYVCNDYIHINAEALRPVYDAAAESKFSQGPQTGSGGAA